MFKSIRHGLFAALAGFTIFICVCYTGLALVISYVTEDMLVDRLLAREADAIALHYRQHGIIKPPDLALIRVYQSALALPANVRAQVDAGRQRAEIATDSGQHYHLRTLDLAGAGAVQRLYLVADVGPLLVVAKLFQDVGGFLTAVALGLIALALLLAYWLSRRLVAPLQLLAREVHDVAPGQSITFTAQGRRDEIGYLADRLHATIGDLHVALRREHDFTRDVGHELRTPLTIMHNVLARGNDAPLAAHDTAQLRAGLTEMRHTIDVLFALARAEHIAVERFDLRGVLEERLLRLMEDGSWHGSDVAIDLPDRLPVTGNRHLCTLLVDNCLRNALFHGGAGCRLQLAYTGDTLTVINTVAPQAGAGMQGFQHGQHLLLRIAAAMQWQIAFHAGAGQYHVTITPAAPVAQTAAH
jgi:signal transduction histidine kinase